jgi:hypothetical protein
VFAAFHNIREAPACFFRTTHFSAFHHLSTMSGNLPTTVSVGEQSRPLSIKTNNSPRPNLTGAVHNDEIKRSGQEELELVSHDESASTDKENATTIHTDAIKPKDNCAIPNYVPPDFDAIMATLLKDEKELTKEQFDEKYPWQSEQYLPASPTHRLTRAPREMA